MEIIIPSFLHSCLISIISFPFDTIKTRMQTGRYNSIKDYFTDNNKNTFKGVSNIIANRVIKRTVQFSIAENLLKENNYFMIGGLVGGSSSLITTPLQVSKIRSQLNNKYVSFQDLKMEKSLYRGFLQNMLRDTLFGCFFMGFYFTFREKKMHPFLNGVLTHTITWTCLLPIDYIKTEYQKSKTKVYFLDILKNTPLKNYWRGLTPSLLRGVPVTGFGMLFYEIIKRKFN